MSKKIDGFKAALEMLQKLDLSEQQRILSDIARQDPEMAVNLKKKLTTFDDLQYLTSQMFTELLKNLSLSDLGLALRGASRELSSHLLKMMSQNNQAEVNDVLKGKPRPLSEVLAAQEKIMQVVLELKAQGKIVLSKDGSEKWV